MALWGTHFDTTSWMIRSLPAIKRVAAAIGEGSMAVRLLLERLQAFGISIVEPTSVGR